MKKILVIEDDELLRENLLEVLEIEGFDVISAPDGRQGLELTKEQLPDLVLCDLLMPELNGYEVLNALRQDSATAKIPLLFLTASAAKVERETGMRLGANGYITKPCTITELKDAIAFELG